MSKPATVQAILETCCDRGIMLNVAGERLSVDAPKEAITPNLLDGLQQHKASLLDLLRRSKSEQEAVQCNAEHHNAIPVGTASNLDIAIWAECVEPREPCPTCDGLIFWWDVLGGQHCRICEKLAYQFNKAAELRELAKQLRKFPKKTSFFRRGS